jgi:hypothetical protein
MVALYTLPDLASGPRVKKDDATGRIARVAGIHLSKALLALSKSSICS